MAQYQPDPAVMAYGAAARAYPQAAPYQAHGKPLGSPPTVTTGNLPRLSFRQRLAVLIAGADAPFVLFPPQQPLQPVAQPPEMGVQGRAFDYMPGFNLWVTPRTQEAISFGTLKALAGPGGYDVLRILIERVKDKIVAGKWSIQPKDPEDKADERCDMLEQFFAFPDQETSWQDWTRKLLEQAIVYDAPAIWLQATRGGKLYSMEVMDGSLFTPKITQLGRAPKFNEGPAYQQVIKLGLPAVDYIRPVPLGQPIPIDPSGYPFPELLYKPRNPRVDVMYGFGPVEQIITTINIGLSREAYLQSYYTHGSRPDTVWTTPATWTTAQIVDFKTWWDAVLAGQIQNRSGGAMFVPDGAKPFDMREKALTDETDQWLIRIMCFALGLSPMPFIKMMNRATGQQHHQQDQEEGLGPWQRWLSDLFETVIRIKFGWSDLSFRWEEEEAVDPVEQATIDMQMVMNGIYHPDEIRAKRGDDPMTPDLREQMDMAAFNPNGKNATVLSPDQQAAQNEHSLAMAAAKPAPVVAAKPNAAESAATKAHELELAKLAQPNIHVDAPQITLPAAAPITVTSPPVNVTTPAVTVTLPEMKAADVFVDVGATTVKIDAPKAELQRKGERSYRSGRDTNGDLFGEIIDTVTRKVRTERDKDGRLIAKVDE